MFKKFKVEKKLKKLDKKVQNSTKLRKKQLVKINKTQKFNFCVIQ